jgi:hypothetical protein
MTAVWQGGTVRNHPLIPTMLKYSACSFIIVVTLSDAGFGQPNQSSVSFGQDGRLYISSENAGVRYEFYILEKTSNQEGDSYTGRIRVDIRDGHNSKNNQILFYRVECADKTGGSPQVFYQQKQELSSSETPEAIAIDPKRAEPPKDEQEPYRLWWAVCRDAFLPASSLARLQERKSDTAAVSENDAKRRAMECEAARPILEGRGSGEYTRQWREDCNAIGTSFNFYNQFDMYGGDLQKLENLSLRECVAACQSDDNCPAYSYDRWYKFCYLKSSISALLLDPTSISAARANLKEPPASDLPVRFERANDRALTGSEYRDVKASTRKICENACQEDRRCVGYTFAKNNQTCQLFTHIKGFSSENDSFSGMKTQLPP